ncbi:[FeFe] hydrogenase H-cluster maturation GTPase HydF [Tepidimicrobium xylanilyticum]|uniref:Iron-only hydrogenase maturation protein HydF n=1 Tax=Tepidimicrobium xylanilyticum TaxID=1123352 RepID=A0A1H3B8E2_9FIRM|nr:[FeFe] hydrogenase H-cluster maturation GTPase HydF [Tepidimicrobium xylanilyticum]GMG96976.1 [FeFe] hydrogenase H-cluster maturation GTPase HydF [Tepidimicrobium xylanilyticum]SDX37921.1 iron-only hydrogenase maturation protein HydF [Tepidimicrobium xylanilyticum]
MKSTPKGNRIHIGLYGKRNVGKSSIMNAIIGQEISLVSDIKGTTTDPVLKAMELIPIGPVVFIDTGGIDDEGELGKLRVEKTIKTLGKVDLALYVMEVDNVDDEFYEEIVDEFNKRNIPHITVMNKIDKVSDGVLKKIKERWNNAVFISTKDSITISNLKDEIIKKLGMVKEETLIGDIIPYGGKVIMVIPIDEEAPKGRLILPQVQLIRDCLDHGIKSYVVRDKELKSALDDLKDADLVITDSQAFKEVDKIVPRNIKLTSFSIIMARQKGDLNFFLDGIKAIEKLKEMRTPKILIMESCSHNTSHEDIGKVKIPKMLTQYLDKEIIFQFRMGEDFPVDLESYDLVVHCGSCMLNKRTMENRIKACREEGVPITNYGILLAYLTGILDRAVEVFI